MDQDYNQNDDETVDHYYEQEYRSINSVKEHQGNILALRQELSEYVEDLNDRKDDDGNSFLKMPSNFDAIVCSMTREDINIEPQNGIPPWSQYLLLDSLNAESDADYNGRYAKAFSETPDIKIKRGLAQIEMLDRQLRDASKSITSVDERNDSSRDYGDADQTFVTIGPNLTNKSPQDSDSKISLTSRSNKNSIITNKKLLNEREVRLQRLLGCTQDEDIESVLGTYLDMESQQQIISINSQLAKFGRLGLLLERVDASPGLSEEGAAKRPLSGLTQTDQPDYLTQQRLAREAKEAEIRIDRLLRECSNQSITYEDLVETNYAVHDKNISNVNESICSRGEVVEAATSLWEVPPVQQVNLQRPITHHHIKQLLADLAVSSGFSAKSDVDEQCTSTLLTGSAVDGAIPLKAAVAVENRAAIRDLVRKYQRDVEALALVRKRLKSEEVSCIKDHIVNTLPVSLPRDLAAGNTGSVEELSWLNLREEAPQCALNMAHPAVHDSDFCFADASMDYVSCQQYGIRDDLANATKSPRWNLRMHLQQKPAGSRSVHIGKDAEALGDVSGWLPPLPPRSSSGFVREPVQDVPVRRSPPKSIRLSTRSSPELVTVFRSSQEYAAEIPDNISKEVYKSSAVNNRLRQPSTHGQVNRDLTGTTSLHRANKASNVLNSMSSLLAKEMRQQQDTEKMSSMRI